MRLTLDASESGQPQMITVAWLCHTMNTNRINPTALPYSVSRDGLFGAAISMRFQFGNVNWLVPSSTLVASDLIGPTRVGGRG